MKILFIILPIVLLLASGGLIYFLSTHLKVEKTRTVTKKKKAFNYATQQQEEHEYTEDETYVETSKKRKAGLVGLIIVAIISALTLTFVPASIHQIEAGEVAVVKVWGDAKEVRTAGIHFDFWVSHKYDIYDCKVQQTTVTTQTYSSDGQTMDVELVIQYQIQQENAMKIATNYGGLEMLESRIETVSIEKMKSVLSQKQAMTIIETRREVSPDVENAIRNAITNDYFVNIVSVVLTDISFTDAFEKTVEDKMIAEQEKLKAEYEKQKAIIQAEQALEVARLDAEAKLAEAEGEANALQTIAKAQANAIKLKSIEAARMLGFEITETATEDGVEYNIDFTGKSAEEIKLISEYLKYIEYLSVWNGELPNVLTDTGANILVTP